jgi:hypothetical protein
VCVCVCVCVCVYVCLLVAHRLADVFALSDPSGQSRTLALYSSGVSRTLTVFYASQGQFSQASAPSVLADGKAHTVLLSAKTDSLTLTVDDTVVIMQSLPAPIDACGGPCFFYLGQRSNSFGGDFFLTGAMTAAWATPLTAASPLGACVCVCVCVCV